MKQGNPKLTDDDVKEIKKLLSRGLQQKFIAKKFGVSRNTITSIKAGRSWKHIP